MTYYTIYITEPPQKRTVELQNIRSLLHGKMAFGLASTSTDLQPLF